MTRESLKVKGDNEKDKMLGIFVLGTRLIKHAP